MAVEIGVACEVLHISGMTYKRYREKGLTDELADRLAVRAGYHPAEVWPEWAAA